MTKHKKDKPLDEQNNLTESEENKSEVSENVEEHNLEQDDAKIAELEKQVKDWQEKLLRKAAEFENYKRRTENDQFSLINYGEVHENQKNFNSVCLACIGYG